METFKPYHYQPIDNTITLEMTKESIINRFKSITKMDKIFYFKEEEYKALKEVFEEEVKNASVEEIQLIREVYNDFFYPKITMREAGQLAKHFLPIMFEKFIPSPALIILKKLC